MGETKTIKITKQLSDAFCQATKDTNGLRKTHACEFQLELLIEDAAQKLAEDDNVAYRCVWMETEFNNALALDSEVAIDVKRINEFGEYLATMLNEGRVVARSNLMYAPDGRYRCGPGFFKSLSDDIKLQIEDMARGKAPCVYRLSREDALRTVAGFERDEHAIRNHLLALSSDALNQSEGRAFEGTAHSHSNHVIVIHPYAHRIIEESVLMHTAIGKKEGNKWVGLVYAELADPRLKTPLFAAQLSMNATPDAQPL